MRIRSAAAVLKVIKLLPSEPVAMLVYGKPDPSIPSKNSDANAVAEVGVMLMPFNWLVAYGTAAMLNFLLGEAVPIPTLPERSMVARTTPLVRRWKGYAAFDQIQVE